MRSTELLAALLVALLSFAAAPRSLSAQDCTVKCSCLTDGCGCHSTGGNGQECQANGSSCAVTKCGEVIRPVGFAPDGRVLVQDTPLPQLAVFLALRRPGVRLLETGEWETAGPGHAVARGCLGIVLAEWFARETAADLRAASGELLI